MAIDEDAKALSWDEVVSNYDSSHVNTLSEINHQSGNVSFYKSQLHGN